MMNSATVDESLVDVLQTQWCDNNPCEHDVMWKMVDIFEVYPQDLDIKRPNGVMFDGVSQVMWWYTLWQ